MKRAISTGRHATSVAHAMSTMFFSSVAVGQFERIAETSTVFHRVGYVYPHRQRGHHAHKGERKFRHHVSAHREKHEYAQRELKSSKRNRHNHKRPVGQNVVQRHRSRIVLQLVQRAQWVDSLHVSREDERDSQYEAADVHSRDSYISHYSAIFIAPKHA